MPASVWLTARRANRLRAAWDASDGSGNSDPHPIHRRKLAASHADNHLFHPAIALERFCDTRPHWQLDIANQSSVIRRIGLCAFEAVDALERCQRSPRCRSRPSTKPRCYHHDSIVASQCNPRLSFSNTVARSLNGGVTQDCSIPDLYRLHFPGYLQRLYASQGGNVPQ